MNRRKYRYKKLKYTYIKTTVLTLLLGFFIVRGYTPFVRTGENFFHVQVTGENGGTLESREKAEELLIEARRKVASESRELVFMETELVVTGEEVVWGLPDSEKEVLKNMEDVLRNSVIETMHRSYALKVDDYVVNLASLEEVTALLQTGIHKYDLTGKFAVELSYDTDREFSVLSADVKRYREEAAESQKDYSRGGIAEVFAGAGQPEKPESEKDFEDYELGIQEMSFSESVEVVEAYLPETQLTSLEVAVEEVIKEQETASIYEVVKGDTLTEIAMKVNIPMDKIIEMNDSLEDENTVLQIGQQLVITVPEPELSVIRTEQNYIEEIYDAEVIIIDVDDWYTTQTEILQHPSAGFRKIIANTTYLNDKAVSREIVKEEVVMEAVPKIMKRGTKIPPTYIKPLAGGRISSYFGRRKAPTAGASTYHKGIDWATPVGTAVKASSGGVVVSAGWGSGYGYVIYIKHPDGKQTRYAHLSKILVSAGQTVKQGDRIALSGNTGITSGPHLHFEILVNGVQVNPLDYVPQ